MTEHRCARHGRTRMCSFPSLTSCVAGCSLLLAPAGLMSGHQQALLSLIANVTQQMQICSRPYSAIGPASGHYFR